MKLNSLAGKVPNYPGRKALERVVGPLVAPLAARYAGYTIQRLLGLWVLHATYGDLFALVDAGVISRAGVYKQAGEFADVFGVEIGDFLPELAQQLHESGLALKVGHEGLVRPLKASGLVDA